MVLSIIYEICATIFSAKNFKISNDQTGLTRSAVFLIFFIVVHAVGNLHVSKGPDDFNGYGYFYVRLYRTSFGFPSEFSVGVCLVECAITQLRWFGEDLGYWFDVAHMALPSTSFYSDLRQTLSLTHAEISDGSAPSCYSAAAAQCPHSGTSNFVPMSSARKWRNCTLSALRPWYKGDLVAHLAVLPNNHEDKAVFRDVFEHLGRSLSPEKHLRHWCWPLRPARVRTLKTKPSVSWRRLTSSSTPSVPSDSSCGSMVWNSTSTSVFKGRPDDFNGYGYFYVRLYCTCLGFQANIVEEYVLLSVLEHIFVGFEEDSRSEVNLTCSTGTIISMFDCTVHALDSRRTSSRNTCCLSVLQQFFVGLKRTRGQKLSSGLMSGQSSLAITG